ncbi:MAG TPA: UbiA prenyltransferase family protein [Longimicrobium sp.]|jgi:4-hydroxybenzoate polyprenyltransferase
MSSISSGQLAGLDAGQAVVSRPTLQGHLQIARVDHWVKNVFVLPGIVVAVGMDPAHLTPSLVPRALLGLLAVGLIASSNYTINEVLDAPYDRTHPVKSQRPVPSGAVSIPLAYVQWLGLALVGVALGAAISPGLGIAMIALWAMGCIYNIPPIRSKEIPYLDVLSEAVNNPIRLLAGWYIVGPSVAAPASLLASYWMVGCYFMAIKRYAELRFILDASSAALYRRSFAHYTLDRLLVSIMFYASAAMLCFGAFIIRYRVELILAFPLVALVMSLYLRLGFEPGSAAEAPEKLYRQRGLLASVVAAAAVMGVLSLVDVPAVRDLLAPQSPEAVQVVAGE